MGGVVQAISGVASDIGNAVTGGIESIGNTVSEVGNAIGSAVQSIGNAIKPVVQKIESDPIGTIAQVAAVATGQVWALPIISAADTIAHGGNLTQAVESAGMSYVGGQIAAGVSDALLAPASDSLSSMMANDASNMAAQGIPADQIANTLQQTYSNELANLPSSISPTDFTNSLANAAANGVAPNTLATAFAGAFGDNLDGVLNSTTQQILAGAAGNSVGAAAKSLALTGNIDNALISGLAAGVGTTVGGAVNVGAQDLGAGSTISAITGKIAGATAASAVAGKNVGASFVNSLINTSLNQIGSTLKNTDVAQGVSQYLSKTGTDIASQINQDINGINSQQTQQQNYYTNTVQPAYQSAQTSYNNLISANDAYTTAYNSYNSDYNKYTDLVSQYNTAKAANDVTTANSLADQINTLATSLNSQESNLSTLQVAAQTAGDTYNTNYQAYQNITTNYTGQTQAITDANTQLDAAAKQAQTQISDYTTKVQDAVQQSGTMSTAAQQGFNSDFKTNGDPTNSLQLATTVNALPTNQQDYFSFANQMGLSATDSLTYAPQLATMSTTAVQTFFDQVNNSNVAPADAFKVANQVNSLTDAQQAALNNATSQGLSISQALTIANSPVANLGVNAQNMYIQATQNGSIPSELAQAITATEQIVDPGAAATNINAAAQSQLTTPEQIAAYNALLAKDPTMTPTDAVKMVLDAVIPSAQADTLPATQQTVPGVYHQDPTTGKWGIYVKDPTSGQLTNTGIVLASAGADATSKYVEGAPSGDQFPVTKNTDGTPNLSMIPISTTTPDTTAQTQTTKAQLDSELASGQITQGEYNDAIKNIATTTTPSVVTDPYQQLIDNLFTSKSTGTGTGTTATATTPGGTGTGTATVPGGASGNGAGTGTIAGTGAGAGTISGTGTGAGGTAIGTGGGGGTGTVTTSGGTGLSYGSPSTAQTNPGITNLVGTFAPTKDASLIGLEQNQNMTTPSASYNPYFAGLATGGSTSNLSSNSVTGVGDTSNQLTGLTPSLRAVQQAALLGIPTLSALASPEYGTQIQSVEEAPPVIHLATGGGLSYAPVFGHGRPTALLGTPHNEAFGDMTGRLIGAHAAGGEIDDHVPEFHSEGGLQHRYVQGAGDGTSDSVKAMLANGEFVIPADVVSDLGNGSNQSGAKVLDSFLSVIRAHKQKHDPSKLPPDSKGPLAYLLAAKKKAKV